MRMKLCLTSAVLLLVSFVQGHANLLFEDAFDYPDGNLVGVAGSPWVAHSDEGSNPVTVQSGQINVVSGNGAREDVSVLLTGQPFQTGGSVSNIYASFTVNCSVLPTAVGTYFAHFQQSTNIFRCRVWASTANAANGTFRLGVGNSSLASASSGQVAQDLQLNTNYRVMVRYEIGTGLSTIWINPTVETTGGITADDTPTAIDVERFGFRQGTSSGSGRSGTIAVDGLLIGSTFDDVLVVDAPPTITALADQQINANSDTGPLSFTIGDDQLSPDQLTVSADSDNLGLVPLVGIVLGGTGADRTVTVTPAANQVGVANITLTVGDGVNLTQKSFKVTVVDNEPPTITSIGDRQIIVDNSTGPIGFTIGDAIVSADNLVLGKDSDNQQLVPLSGIVFGGTGTDRTVNVTPATGQTGTALITIAVSDGSNLATTSFQLTVVADAAPTISTIADQQVPANGSVGPIGLTVGDDLTDPASLTLTSQSSDETLVPLSGITFGGSGSSRTVSVAPAARKVGSATITVTVSDGNNLTPTSFLVTVVDGEPPSVSPIADQSLPANSSTGPLAFTVADNVVLSSGITINPHSDNLNLVPLSAISLGGSGGNRTITVTPATDQTGSATISLDVSDGANVASTSFTVTVGVPAIAAVVDQFTPVNTALGPIPISISHGALDPATLVLTAQSSNEALVPASGLALGGASSNRSLTVTPATDQTGVATITLNLSDGVQSAQRTFTVTVHPYLGLLFSDDFSRPEEGPVVDDVLWFNHGGTPYETQIILNQLWLSQLQSEDFHRRLHPTINFAPSASNVVYVAFRMNMSELPNGSGSYFAHLNTNSFRSRIFVRTNFAAADHYRVGIANASLNPLNDSFLDQDLALNQDYNVVFRYSVASGESRLWIDPTSPFSSSVAASDTPQPVTIDTFSFRQSDPGNPLGMGVLTVDDLKVGTSFADVVAGSLPVPLSFLQVNQTLRLSWPTGRNYLLQRADTIPATSWTGVPFVTESSEDVANIDTSAGSGFFRLLKSP